MPRTIRQQPKNYGPVAVVALITGLVLLLLPDPGGSSLPSRLGTGTLPPGEVGDSTTSSRSTL